MRHRTAILAAATVLALLVTGLAWAASDTTDDIASSETNVAIATGQQQTIPVDSAGSVVLLRTDTQLQILSVIPNTGYTPEIEVAAGREVEVDFRGEGRRVKFNAELEDGQVRIRIEIEGDDNSSSTSSTASTSSTSSTSTTLDDRGDDDSNNSGSGSGGSDDDSSGHDDSADDDDDNNSGSGSNDDNSDDDNSGSGSSGDDDVSGHDDSDDDDSDDDDDNSGSGSDD